MWLVASHCSSFLQIFASAFQCYGCYEGSVLQVHLLFLVCKCMKFKCITLCTSISLFGTNAGTVFVLSVFLLHSADTACMFISLFAFASSFVGLLNYLMSGLLL